MGNHGVEYNISSDPGIFPYEELLSLSVSLYLSCSSRSKRMGEKRMTRRRRRRRWHFARNRAMRGI